MHDLLRELGQSIESKLIERRPKPLAERQRIWTRDEVLEALTKVDSCYNSGSSYYILHS